MTEQPETKEMPKTEHKILLAASWILLLGWLAFLANLSFSTANFEAVSQPQVLAAPAIVRGELLIDPPRVKIEKVLYASKAAGQNSAVFQDGQTYNLVQPSNLTAHWDRTTSYLLPIEQLTKTAVGVFPIPDFGNPKSPNQILEMPIYPVTESNLRQIQALIEFRKETEAAKKQ